jgi:hypothetical protein
MGKHYRHLGLEERCQVAELHQAGQSIQQIAAALDRSPSSISRELKRNRGVQVGYKPTYAQERAAARRWKGSRLERNAELRDGPDSASRGAAPSFAQIGASRAQPCPTCGGKKQETSYISGVCSVHVFGRRIEYCCGDSGDQCGGESIASSLHES